MTGQGPGFAGQNTSLVDQKRKKGRESDRPGQALARQNPKFVGHLTDDWLLFAGLLFSVWISDKKNPFRYITFSVFGY